MLGESKVQALTKQVLSYAKADQTEVLILGEDSGLTRFANSYIHQNVAETNTEVRVRVVLGRKIGVSATNDLSTAGLKKVVESATTIARFQQDNPDFKSLPGPAASYPKVNGFIERTASVSPEQRARGVSVICKKCITAGVTGSGALTTAVNEYAVANSLGTFAYFATTRADLNTVVMSDTGSGYAEAASLDFSDLNFEAMADEAVSKATKSRNPVSAEPGEYTVIFEEYAVTDFVNFLGYLGFSALAVQEGRSFMKLGEKVVGDNISIWDDGLDVAGLPIPFDFEGVPKARVPLIEKGVAKAVVYDSYTAGKEGKQSTGHGLPAPNTFGPIPLNTFMATGKNTKEEMLKSTKKGLWVTRLHYTRPVHPLKVIVTGMTRDGTFLIENGEITKPVRNFRFTQGYLDALSNVEMISNTAKTLSGFPGSSRVPALKISKFNFTGVTEF
jgi:PmbA protein